MRRIGFGRKPAIINIDLARAWTWPDNLFSCDGVDEIIPAVQQKEHQSWRALGWRFW